MKHIFKSAITFTLALALLLSSSMPTRAAEVSVTEPNDAIVSNDIDGGLSTYSNSFENGAVITTSWQTVATSTTGFNCDVYIKCMNTGTIGWQVSPTDIQLLDRHGNVVWSQKGAVAGQGDAIFWCGSNIYEIQAKTQTGKGTIYIRKA